MNGQNEKDKNEAIEWIYIREKPKGLYRGKYHWLVDYKYFTDKNLHNCAKAQIYVSQDGIINRLFG
jgi:hypothetical protein